MEKGTLYGVSIGPGDPELITVKDWNKRFSRIVYCK